MSNFVLHSTESSGFSSYWNRVRLLLIATAVAISLCTTLLGQSSYSTGTDQTPSVNGQSNTPPVTNQSGMSLGDQGGAAQHADQSSMSADQIIGILRQQPTILATVKDVAAQKSGVDPGTISDDELFGHIQQNASVRVQITQQLNKLGYATNAGLEDRVSASDKGAAGTVQTRRRSSTQTSPDVNQDEPKSVQRPDPYGDLPSLHDLYTQIPSAGGKLQRFGSDAFLLGTGNANELPMDLPVGPDYVLGPGDNIIVNMWGGHSERLSLTIDRQGQIALPEAGTLMLDRLTVDQAQAAIQKALGTQFQDEHVEISLGRLRTVRIYVVGDVQRPGAYDVSSMSTPLSALYAAGGPTSRGSLRILRQYRGKELVREVDLYDFLLHGVRSDSDRLLPGDTIMVPTVGSQVSVEGMVHHPAIYELNGEQGLDQILDLAGGVLITANLKQINVERIEANQRRTMLSLELPDDAAGSKQKLTGFRVQNGDDVVISQILPYNQQAVYLEGHVFRPGKYPYRDGMTINDLLHSYQDVMPEPADHAELVRLQSPDYRPETISFSLTDALIGNVAIRLQPFDQIHIYSRYEIDSPRVSIEGEVLRPGEYPMSQGMTAAGLVRMAGGFKRSAYQDEADVSSYTVQDGQKVLIDHKDVSIKTALDGDSKSDIVLKPGDVVSIRQLAGWLDIGSSVTVTGEVEHAGTYGISQGERLSSVIKRTGGFRDGAYPAAAVLERVQVRQLSEQSRQEMIRRIETTPVDVKPGTMSVQDQSALQQSLQQQRQQVLEALRNHPASGRQVINISSDVSKWEGTSADIELRAGDSLVIPKQPNFIIVSGQVYNATAISFVPGRTAGWYLQKSGGVTQSGDKKQIYILRADGSVIGHSNSWINGSFMSYHLRPGDSIIVPEKIIGDSALWRNLIGTAQIMSSAALPLAIAGVL